MIVHGKQMKLFAGNSNPELAKGISESLGIPLGNAVCTQFADGECSVSVYEPVRGADVFLIQSTCGPVNDNLMELLILIDAMRRASAGRITAVIPYFGYARQDRKAKSRDPISAKLVANLVTVAGADRVLTMDLHASQIQGFFDIPVDNMLGGALFASHYIKRFGANNDDFVVASPDVGSVARSRAFAMKLGCGLVIVDKRRERANQSEVMNLIGSVEGKNVIILDDMARSAARPTPSSKRARTRSTPARPTASSPIPRSSASKTAPLRSCCFSTRCPIRRTMPGSTRSNISLSRLCSLPLSAASTTTSPWRSCLPDALPRRRRTVARGVSRKPRAEIRRNTA